MINIYLDPTLWRWGPLTVGWHGVWLAAGMLAGYLIWLRTARRAGLESDLSSTLYACLLLATYVGGRLVYVLQNWPAFAVRPASMLAIYEGGWTVFGGIFFGFLFLAVYAWRAHLPFWPLADAAVLPVIVADLIGRVGCTLNGDIHGLPTGSAWGLAYWHAHALVPFYLRGVPLYPIPTLFQVLDLGLLLALLLLRKRALPAGVSCLIILIGYAIGRALISIWQPMPALASGLNATQILSLVVVVAGSVCLGLRLRSRSVPAATPYIH